ncbi:DUF2278 family protein [Clostridium sp.]
MHVNQGNEIQYESEEGVFFIHYPVKNKLTVIFFSFKSQSFNTDENGHIM